MNKLSFSIWSNREISSRCFPISFNVWIPDNTPLNKVIQKNVKTIQQANEFITFCWDQTFFSSHLDVQSPYVAIVIATSHKPHVFKNKGWKFSSSQMNKAILINLFFCGSFPSQPSDSQCKHVMFTKFLPPHPWICLYGIFSQKETRTDMFWLLRIRYWFKKFSLYDDYLIIYEEK